MIYLDIISQKKPGHGGSKNWFLLQDSYTEQKWFLFMKTKEELTEKVTPFPKKLKSVKKNFKIICCYNADKNKTLEKKCAKNFEQIDFKFTSPGTPQQNDVVERGFAKLYYQMRKIMIHTGLHMRTSRLLYGPNVDH